MSESGQVRSEAPQIHSLAVALDGTAVEPPPAWIELIPAGQFNGRDGRGPYRLEDAGKVAATTHQLRMDAGIPIDYDHATDFAAPEGRPAPAAGWIKELAEREGALWGRVEWTQHGAAALATKEYRYISPVFEHDADGVVVRLLRAALTNNPNLYLKAIAAQAKQTREGSDSEYVAGAVEKIETGADLGLEQLRRRCGLPSDVTDQEIVEAVRRILLGESGAGTERSYPEGSESFRADVSKSDETGDAPDYVGAETFAATARELNELRERNAGERAVSAVERAIQSGKIVPAQREWALSYCKADYDGFHHFVARQPTLTLNVAAVEGKPRKNWASEPETGLSGELSGVERAVCSRLGIGTEQFAKRKAVRASVESQASSFTEV